ncbi:MAG: TonB-dependent receptor [Sulfurimonas sp. RIFOXYD12_FULL_33_39]|uniref:TonB-dependent receptor n=1 Tax=unclassified Sulfurimonas TaxID=2623549 RepID=UPI0008ACDBFC|nr:MULTISPECIES: TonB-dependent receptor [unclassified Sulfurimonas]OHE10566.1 MAG: TonB-dependent receptor [Sulfurimonas sp. RIFOXYD12_FULL_33_39]OHE15025.1 MAG: TonB-dependent receptor [Sulfurimonas sp. RIFOXYD2_FULL_34_21]
MKITILLLFFTALLYSNDTNLDNLLSEYRDADELYFNTKEEKSGHLILFSRSDLDKMQAYTLNDVLKTIRMFTLKNTRFGMSSIVRATSSEQATPSVKILINSYELTSITSGTGLAQFGKMGLNFIDHIEVYQASNNIAFSGEPGNMIIKMYTKDPSRENATIAQASVDSKKGSRVQVIDVNSYGEYSYLANIDINNNNFNEYKSNSSTLSRDGNRGQFYFNFSKKNDYTIEAGSAIERYNLFSGFGPSITDGLIDTRYSYAQYTKYFGNSLKLILSTTYEKLDIDNSDATGITLFDDTISSNINVRTGSYANSVTLEKRYSYKENNFLFGAQIKQKSLFLDEFKSNTLSKPITLGPKDLDIYMLYFEDVYNINEDNQIVMGAKIDYYKDSFNKSSTENVLRLAYISKLNDDFSIKAFLQENYSYPIFAQTTFSPINIPNPNLESSKALITKIEAQYKKENLTLTIAAGASKSKNPIVLNPTTKMYVNSDKESNLKQFCISSNYKFDADNKVVLEYFKAYKDSSSFSSKDGALVQLYNRVNKFDIYNELVYRSSYTGYDGVAVESGYDYTAGIIYHYSKKLDLKLKGENLLDKASQTSINNLKVPTLERRAIFTLEYIF